MMSTEAGTPVQILRADTRGDPKLSASEAERLILDEKVNGILGPFQTVDVYSAVPLGDQHKVPFLSPTFVAESAYNTGSRYVRGLNIANSAYATGMADFLLHLRKQGANITRIALAYDNSEYGRGVSAMIKERLAGSDLKVVLDLPVTPPVTDYTPQILRVRDSGAQAFVTCFFFPETALVLKAVDVSGLRIPTFVAGSSLTDARMPGTLGAEVAQRVLSGPVFGAHSGTTLDTRYEPLRRLFKAATASGIKLGADSPIDAHWLALGAQSVYAFKAALDAARSNSGEALNTAMQSLRLERGNELMVLPFYEPALEWEANGKPRHQTTAFAQWSGKDVQLVYPSALAQAAPRMS